MSLPRSFRVVLILSFFLYAFIGYGLVREQFFLFISTYLLLFAAYIFLLKRDADASENFFGVKGPEHISNEKASLLLTGKSNLYVLLIAGMLFRALFIFSLPALSDDYFRFAWDGTMSVIGENPFTILPSAYISECDHHVNYLIDLFNGMNSPDYYTVYPPVGQFVFTAASWLFAENLTGTVVVLHIFNLLAEAGSIWILLQLMEQLKLPKRNVLLYALNPLVIIELSGNLHLEALMIFFLLLSLHLLMKARIIKQPYNEPSFLPAREWRTENKKEGQQAEFQMKNLLFSGMSFCAAIACKLIPLMFLPLLARRLKWKYSFLYFSTIGITMLISFLPFINRELVMQWGSSLQLYFQKFEFNAGFYYIVRWIGYWFTGYDIILRAGPWMAVISLLIIAWLTIREKDESYQTLFETMQWVLTVFLLFATTVHPWYITTLVLFSVFTGYRYPLIWSLFVALSYATYQTYPYQERLLLTGLEYASVGIVMVLEIMGRRKSFGKNRAERVFKTYYR